jgi:hypothetical protein
VIDTYLTDGVNLYRVAAVLGRSKGPQHIELEDCRTLEVTPLTSTELRKRRLTPVHADDPEERVGARARALS